MAGRSGISSARRRPGLNVAAAVIWLSCGLSAVVSVSAQETAATQPLSIWVCTLAADGSSSERRQLPDSLAGIRSLAVCANTSQIAVHLDAHPSSVGARVWIAAADGSGSGNVGRGRNPEWSPRGGRLLVTTETPESGVWIIRSDGSDRQLIDTAGSAAAWSPQGLKIAYVRTLNGQANIVIFDLAELEYRAVGTSAVGDYRSIGKLAWSPDSERLACYGQTINGEYQLATVSVDGKAEPDVVSRTTTEMVIDLCWPAKDRLVTAMDSADQNKTQLFVVPLSAHDESVGHQNVRPVRIDGQFSDRNNFAVSVSRQDGVIHYISGP